uniref:Uncharacterized protein n=1 Tax=Rhipicephalus zambeziensis TaxID=60191 RepID=A0A224YAA8_9ACAR
MVHCVCSYVTVAAMLAMSRSCKYVLPCICKTVRVLCTTYASCQGNNCCVQRTARSHTFYIRWRVHRRPLVSVYLKLFPGTHFLCGNFFSILFPLQLPIER